MMSIDQHVYKIEDTTIISHRNPCAISKMWHALVMHCIVCVVWCVCIVCVCNTFYACVCVCVCVEERDTCHQHISANVVESEVAQDPSSQVEK